MPLREVALLRCPDYAPERLQAAVGQLLAALDFRVAAWFLDQGARVAVGDSPAFGSSLGVMAKIGLRQALAGLPVELVNFDRVRPAGQPAQDQGPRSDPGHPGGQELLRDGEGLSQGPDPQSLRPGAAERFARLLVDLLAVLPPGISLADGVVAMHRDGPTGGASFPLGLVAAARNPVALDTALLAVLGIAPERSLLWRECARRGLPGVNWRNWPFLWPRPRNFQTPTELSPLPFDLWRLCRGGIKRLRHRLCP